MSKDKGSEKADNLRAMRERQWEEAQRRATAVPSEPVARPVPDPTVAPARVPPTTSRVSAGADAPSREGTAPSRDGSMPEPPRPAGKRGRPALPEGERLDGFSLRLPPRERAELERIAREDGVPVAAALRALVRAGLDARRRGARPAPTAKKKR